MSQIFRILKNPSVRLTFEPARPVFSRNDRFNFFTTLRTLRQQAKKLPKGSYDRMGKDDYIRAYRSDLKRVESPRATLTWHDPRFPGRVAAFRFTYKGMLRDRWWTLRSAADDFQYRIQSSRAAARQCHRSYRELPSGYDYNLVGGVHSAPMFFVSVVKEVKKSRVRKSKKPKTAVKHVGVEIEFLAPHDHDELLDALAETDLVEYVQLKHDQSVREVRDLRDCGCCDCGASDAVNCECSCDCGENESGGDHGHEVCVLASERELPRIIKRVCEFLSGHGAYINRTCGLHVHLDMRQRDADHAYRNLYRAQNALLKLVPRSRRKNQFCKPQTSPELSGSGGDRYRTINPVALDEHSTIEVRLHTGSVSAKKINYWVQLLRRIVDARELPMEGADTIGRVSEAVKLPKRIKAFYIERQRKFQSANAVDSDVA